MIDDFDYEFTSEIITLRSDDHFEYFQKCNLRSSNLIEESKGLCDYFSKKRNF